MRGSRVAAAGIVAIAALALAGCAGTTGAAAVVDGDRLSVADVQETYEAFSGFNGVSQLTVISMLSQAPILIDLGEENGATASTEDAVAWLNSQGLDGDAESFAPPVLEVGQAYASAQAIQALPNAEEVFTQMSERIDALSVEVNPRYGSIDPTTGQGMPTSFPWFDVDAPGTVEAFG